MGKRCYNICGERKKISFFEDNTCVIRLFAVSLHVKLSAGLQAQDNHGTKILQEQDVDYYKQHKGAASTRQGINELGIKEWNFR